MSACSNSEVTINLELLNVPFLSKHVTQWFGSVVVITFALHAKGSAPFDYGRVVLLTKIGPRFETGPNHVNFFGFCLLFVLLFISIQSPQFALTSWED